LYSIGDLEEKTGVTRRTIHFYVQQGVLSSPEGAGPRAAYREEHRLRLLAIPKLRGHGWQLEKIRRFFQMAHLTDIARVIETGNPPSEDIFERRPNVPEATANSQAETLLRYRLAPGVDLVISTNASTGVRGMAERSLPLLTQLFAENSGAG
jgi:DNA-binding transcriptional MerR regulator